MNGYAKGGAQPTADYVMTPSTPTSDEVVSLVQACLRGCEQSQRELIDRYVGLCESIAFRILGPENQADVEDAVQEAFFAVFAKLDQWRGQNLDAGIGVTAARRAIDVRRRLRATAREITGLDETQIDASGGTQPPTDESPDLAEALDIARKGLTGRQQQILDGLLQEKSRAEIAAAIRISERTLYYELGKIRGRLRNSLRFIAGHTSS